MGGAVLGNRMGHAATVRAETAPGTRRSDLGGRALPPGFNDNLTHPMLFGQALGLTDARPSNLPKSRPIQRSSTAASSPSDVEK